MSILSVILLILGIVVLFGLGAATALFLIGRRVLLSWKKPYKRAMDSFGRLSGQSLSFLREFSRQPLLYQWLYSEAVREPAAVVALFCAADDAAKERILALLSKQEQKKLHAMVKKKKKFTMQELDDARNAVKRYMEAEYRNPLRKLSLSFYKLYFYEEYASALQYIDDYKKAVSPVLQEAIESIVVSVLRSIPYYKERRMYEQQHKFEVFVTKDVPDMLTLISSIPPMQRREKEKELTVFLQEFQKDMDGAHTAVEHDLNVKMRAAKEKFHTN